MEGGPLGPLAHLHGTFDAFLKRETPLQREAALGNLWYKSENTLKTDAARIRDRAFRMMEKVDASVREESVHLAAATRKFCDLIGNKINDNKMSSRYVRIDVCATFESQTVAVRMQPIVVTGTEYSSAAVAMTLRQAQDSYNALFPHGNGCKILYSKAHDAVFDVKKDRWACASKLARLFMGKTIYPHMRGHFTHHWSTHSRAMDNLHRITFFMFNVLSTDSWERAEVSVIEMKEKCPDCSAQNTCLACAEKWY